MKQKVILSSNIKGTLESVLDSVDYDKLFVFLDTTTDRLCYPVVKNYPHMNGAEKIVIGSTDTHKTIESLTHVWMELSNGKGSRHSLMINLGGGMVTDLGGFAASTFKRGIPYINIPTTLLSMVDASVGGKTGVNFNGLKNEIGIFKSPEVTIIDTTFLKTLNHENICSGYAEMLKHGLIKTQSSGKRTIEDCMNELLEFDLDSIDYDRLAKMVGESVAIKEDVVEKDPFEKNIRKSLNLGHTAGHAFESFSLAHTPCLHGYAVAWGLMCELYLSVKKIGFPVDLMERVCRFVIDNYGKLAFGKADYAVLYELMTHDKKNQNGIINFTLLGGIGDIKINQTASKEDIFNMLDFYVNFE